MADQENLLTPNFNQALTLPNATTVLVLGIISIVSSFCYGLGLILGVIALVLAKKDLRLISEHPEGYSISSVSNLKAGRICSIIGILISAFFIIIIVLCLIFFMPMIMDAVKKG